LFCLTSVLAILSVCRIGTAEANGREGCVKPATIAKGLTRVQALDLSSISLEQIQTIWPTELKASGCNPGSCLSLEHQGRIINGHRECTEKLEIIPPQKPAPGADRSLSIKIDFSAGQKAEVVAAAKQLAKAAGLGEPMLSSVGHELDEQFQWDHADRHEYCSLWVKTSQSGEAWMLDFHLIRYLAYPHEDHSPSAQH
jgi:hypothetical protein